MFTTSRGFLKYILLNLIIGPFVFKHKQLKAMNLLNSDYLRNRNNASSPKSSGQV